VASASDDGTVKPWDVATGRTRAMLEGHGDEVIHVAFSPDGNLVASAWDVATGRTRATLEGHGDEVFHVVFSPDGKLVASASSDGTVKL